MPTATCKKIVSGYQIDCQLELISIKHALQNNNNPVNISSTSAGRNRRAEEEDWKTRISKYTTGTPDQM